MFRIYTEDTASPDARATALRLLAAHNISGATLYNALGIWRGKAEASLVIETDGAGPVSRPRCDRAAVYDFAEALKQALKQEAVGVVETADTFTLI